MRPIAERVRQRLIVQAIAKIAEECDSDRVTVEDMYSKGRTAIIHLHIDDYYPLDNRRNIETKLNDLLRANDEFLVHARGQLDPKWLANMEYLANRLRPAWEKSKAESAHIEVVTLADIQIMIKVVNEVVRQHVALGYDTAGIIDPKAFLLAQMVAENFDAYEMTLNNA